MRTRIVILAILVSFLLICINVRALSGEPRSHSLAPETASGGDYHLTSLAWQVSGILSSDRYQLQSLVTPNSSENACCCVNLPCILR